MGHDCGPDHSPQRPRGASVLQEPRAVWQKPPVSVETSGAKPEQALRERSSGSHHRHTQCTPPAAGKILAAKQGQGLGSSALVLKCSFGCIL